MTEGEWNPLLGEQKQNSGEVPIQPTWTLNTLEGFHPVGTISGEIPEITPHPSKLTPPWEPKAITAYQESQKAITAYQESQKSMATTWALEKEAFTKLAGPAHLTLSKEEHEAECEADGVDHYEYEQNSSGVNSARIRLNKKGVDKLASPTLSEAEEQGGIKALFEKWCGYTIGVNDTVTFTSNPYDVDGGYTITVTPAPKPSMNPYIAGALWNGGPYTVTPELKRLAPTIRKHADKDDSCGHCGRGWHKRRLTRQVWDMYQSGQLWTSQWEREDISDVLCEGSLFIGPQLPEGRRERAQLLNAWRLPANPLDEWTLGEGWTMADLQAYKEANPSYPMANIVLPPQPFQYTPHITPGLKYVPGSPHVLHTPNGVFQQQTPILFDEAKLQEFVAAAVKSVEPMAKLFENVGSMVQQIAETVGSLLGVNLKLWHPGDPVDTASDWPDWVTHEATQMLLPAAEPVEVDVDIELPAPILPVGVPLPPAPEPPDWQQMVKNSSNFGSTGPKPQYQLKGITS